MGVDIRTLPYNNTLGNYMFEAKRNELLQVANEYNVSFGELQDILHRELSASGTKVGACNTAVDFLIVETLNQKRKYKSVKVAIENNILASAIYYVNGIGKGEYV